MSPRRYNLGRRRTAAEATRTRILDAARALIASKGDIGDYSMEAVAAKAGVSRMTVYNQFHSQPRLLEAVADSLAERGGMQRLASAFVAERIEDAVGAFVGTFVAFWASDRVFLRRLRAMGVLEPSVYRRVRDRDEWRREAARHLVARFGVRAAPVDGRDSGWASDLLATLTSFEVFDQLADETRSPEELARDLTVSVLQAWGPGREGHGKAGGPGRRRRTGP